MERKMGKSCVNMYHVDQAQEWWVKGVSYRMFCRVIKCQMFDVCWAWLRFAHTVTFSSNRLCHVLFAQKATMCAFQGIYGRQDMKFYIMHCYFNINLLFQHKSKVVVRNIIKIQTNNSWTNSEFCRVQRLIKSTLHFPESVNLFFSNELCALW